MKKYIYSLYIKYKEIINYLIVGVLTTIISLAVYYLCTITFLNPKNAFQLQLANVISWIVSVTFAYFTNRKYVFESKNPHIFKEASAFFLARVGTLLMDMGIMFLCVTLMGMNDKIAKLISQVVVIISNYIFSKLFVFKKGQNEK
ncbi:MAG: GtrA family protein [Eubacteriaceae bacterium]|jgi:putative flippase GtrA|uniref:GtrA family protein n=1 Tax=Candidatus Pseudoramibacter fermentans TaxID=2594427 RepID=A0A6L5GSB5_9FIRM|nr:GtrA family protein [Candidatus Pseudoramibacter fermentans]RRF93599.1 MAG: GtrA family protein [Eubacteriaceae bacterium]